MVVQARAALLALAVFMFMNIACGSTKEAIIGRWNLSSNTSGGGWRTIEFFKDGSAVLMGSLNVRYAWGDGDRLKIEFPGSAFTFEAKVSGDTLTLKSDQYGYTAVYRR